jgi:putative ABC transport system substrate-binding protein
MLQSIEEAARSLAVAVQAAPVNDDAELEAMMAGLAREEHGDVLVLPDPFTGGHRDAIVALAARHRLPAVYPVRYFLTSGGLMSYGPDIEDIYRRSADYIDHILKGAKPSELPVQYPTKFELVVSLRTANEP